MKKRLLAIFLAMTLVISVLPITAMAEEDVLSSPDQYTDVSLEDATAYLEGTGTAEDPFQIWNGDDLYYVNYIEYWRDTSGSDTVYYYQQMQDLDLSGAAQFDRDTGYITANFGGVYDGGGYAITGMDKSLFYFTLGDYIGDADGAVFTGYVSGDSHTQPFSAIVRNLVIDQPQITQTVASDVIEQLGAVAAYAVNTTFYNIEVSGGQVNGVSGAAAIAGRAASVVIDSCSSDTTIYTSMHRAAGIVSNLRIVDEKKGATATSLVTNCTFSGAISGNLDGERGAAGIVGAVYMDGESTLRGGAGLPLFVSDCTFSGTLSGTVTSGSGNFGGILGTSYLGPGLNLRNNTVTGTIENITVAGGATAANVGGVVGKMLNYSLLDSELTLVMEGNDTSAATLPDTDPDNLVYVGTMVGCQNDPNRTITGPISLSTAEGLGEYGAIQGAQLDGEIGDLVLPATTGSTQLYILEGATVGSVTADASTGLNIYNYGTVGDVRNTMAVNVYANTGSLGAVTSEGGNVSVGGYGKNAETAGTQVGNEGAMGVITAAGAVTLYRNTGTVAGLTAQTGAVTIGQGNSTTAGVADYNVNAGSVGSVEAATSVTIQSGQVTGGSVATGEGETISAGTSVTIGASGYPNCNDMGDTQAATSVSIYNGKDVALGNVQATTAANVYANEGTIGSVTVTNGAVAVGGSNKTETNAAGQVGNQGVMGDITGTSVTIYRNTGTIGGLTSTTSSVTVGQGNSGTEAVRGYNVNAGTIGSIDAATTVGLYGGMETAGSVAAGEGQAVTAATSVTIGSTTYPNYNTVGAVNAPTVSGYTVGTVGTVTAATNKLVNAGSAEGSDVITASGNVTLTAAVDGTITVGEATYAAGSKLVLTATGTVTFGGTYPVSLSSIEANGTLTLSDPAGLARIGSVKAMGDAKLGLSNESFAGTITGDVTATSAAYVGYSGAYFTGTIGGNITAQTSLSIYNSGTIGGEGKTVTAQTGSITIVNGKSGDNAASVLNSDVVNNSTASTTTITSNSTPMGGDILHQSTGNLTLAGGTGTAAQYTGQISTARALYVNGNLGPNDAASPILVNFTGESGVISVANHIFYLKVSGTALTSVSVASSATTAGRNTVDLSSLADTVSVAKAVGNAAATEVILPAGAAAPADLGTLVSGTINADQAGDTYANGSITVSDGISLSADGTLTITTASATITNYGTIGAVNHLGTGTLTIYNIGADAKIGAVTSAGSVNVGANGKTADNAGTAVGNEGEIASITAAGAINLYRNTGTVGALTSQTASVSIAQGNSTTAGVETYNVNAGTVGSVQAATSVSIHGGAVSGSVAAGNGETIAAATSVTIGSATYPNYNTVGSVQAGTSINVYNAEEGSVGNLNAETTVTVGSTTFINQGGVGSIDAGTTVTIYNGSADMGTVDAGTTVYLYANSGTIGDVSSATSSIYVGADNKTEDNNNNGAYVGNEGILGNLTAYGSVAVKRNTNQIGTLKSTTSSVTIGQGNSTTAGVADYNANFGSIDSVEAATSVAIYSTAAEGQVGTVNAGGTVTIGASTAPNEGKVGAVVTTGGVNVYNGSARLETIHAATGVNLYANDGTIGTVTSDTSSVNVGASGKTEATAAGAVGNSGAIGDLTGTSINVYRNSGTIGNVKATTGAVTIGQSNSTTAGVPDYNVNAGSIGSVDAATNVAIYSGAAGAVATGNSETVAAGTYVTIGCAAVANGNDVGPTVSGTTATLYSGAGQVASLTAGTTNKAYITDTSKDVNLATSFGDVEIIDETTTASPSVNITTDGGDVRVARAEGDSKPQMVKVNLTVTDGLRENQTLFIRGSFASVVHKGAGNVIMESADTQVANVVLQSTGEVQEFGSTGTVTKPDAAQSYLLTLVPADYETLEVYLLTADGSVLPAGQLDLSATGGTLSGAGTAVIGGGTSENLGLVTVDTTAAQSVTVTVNCTYTPDGGEAVALSATAEVTIPAIVERVDLALLTSQEDFEAAAAQYGWTDETTAPAEYPVLAVMPVVNEVYDDADVQVAGTAVNADGVLLVPVDADTALESGTVGVAVEATGAGAPDYRDDLTYTLTETDQAKLDSETAYYYVTFHYMDGKTADKTVPVVQGEMFRLTETAERSGYAFLGWLSDSGTLYTAGNEFKPTADTVLTAQWGADSVTHALTIAIEGSGSVVRVAGDTEYTITSGTSFRAGETVILRAKESASTFFRYWTVDGVQSYEEDLTVTMTGEQTVTATFGYRSSSTGNTYSIAVGSTQNGTVTCTSRAAADSQVIITATPAAGYRVGSVQVLTSTGEQVAVTLRSDGKYVFTMPAKAVRVVAAFVEAAWENPFVDVAPGDWYYDAVAYVGANGLMNGVSATTFRPGLTTSRGMIVTILYRMEGQPAVSGSAFSDVASGQYYANAVAWANANGIVTGYGDGTFRPDTPITREQMAAILYRYAQYKGMDAVTLAEHLSSFSDGGQVSAYAVQAMNWAVSVGLLNGKGNGILDPTGTATRAEAATILMRLDQMSW